MLWPKDACPPEAALGAWPTLRRRGVLLGVGVHRVASVLGVGVHRVASQHLLLLYIHVERTPHSCCIQKSGGIHISVVFAVFDSAYFDHTRLLI